MLKWIAAIFLVLAVLSVAGCCCCSSGYDYSYSTVSQEPSSDCACDTPYDCQASACDGACACGK